MDFKKSPEMEVGRNSSLYFAIGIILMLSATLSLLEHKSYAKKVLIAESIYVESELEEDIPITNIDIPIPPPPQLTITEALVIVEDIEEVEETVIESSEIGQDDAVEERIVKVEEITVEEVEEDIEVPFAVIESVPIFPGCEGKSKEASKSCFQEKIQEHIGKNFRFPEAAQELGISGRVFVMFVIDKNGKIIDIKSRGPDKILEKEAERIISLLPTMTPGKQRGIPVRVPYSIPIHFKFIDR